MNNEHLVRQLLAKADIQINGSRPWDIQVHDDRLYGRVLRSANLGLGEAYMDGWWDCAALDEFFHRLMRADLSAEVRSWRLALHALSAVVMNPQSKSRAFTIGEEHYDIGNDLYKLMLDPRMVYTCGYWKQADSLANAQEAKLDLTCKKLGLKKGDHVLDIGCGWGSFAKFASEKYGARVTGVTVSKEQVALGQKLCAGLPVDFQLKDYRDVEGTFDHIVSLGMFEHVGYKNYNTFFDVARKHLKDDGLFLLHTIGGNRSSYGGDPWVLKYIFPNSMLPSVAQIGKAIERKFVMEDWHNFSADYEKTLLAWYDNFEKSWPELAKLQDEKGELIYSDRFYRMWRYYLLMFAGTFRARTNQLWQIVLSPRGVRGGYQSIR